VKTTILAAALALAAGAQCAQASIYDIVVNFEGGQLGTQTLDITLNFDPATSFGDTSSGLTVNAGTTFSVTGGLVFSYYAPSGFMYIGGAGADSDGIAGGSDDVLFLIAGLGGFPYISAAADSAASMGGGGAVDVTSYSIGTSAVTGVPLPAGLPLALAGVGALGLLARRKRRG